MGSKSVAALLLVLSGWLAAQGGARAGSAAVLAALSGAWLLWVGRAHTAPHTEPLAEPAAPPAPPGELLRLQTLLAQVPAAAWLVDVEDRELQALSNRARRLLAPGAARDPDALRQQLLERALGQQAGQMLIDTERGSERWSLALQPLVLDGRALCLGVLLPLESVLETERLQAWQQLVQVLTHEIMNSLTPIASLAQTATELDDPTERLLALRTIAQRAEGLQRFVADYRRVSDWPPPQLQAVDLQALLSRLQLSIAQGWQARGGMVQVACEPAGLLLRADPAQLEQALLNLVTNATRATEHVAEPRLWVEARLTRGARLRLSVRDNGPGVPAGLEQQIFLPFFSASPGGRGIGLTVARQLVHGMGGRLRHVRPVEGGACFVMSF